MSDKQDLEPLLNVRQNQFVTVTAQGDGIDNKSLGILAADVALLIFALGVDKQSWQVLLVLVPVICSLIFACLALQPKKYVGASVDLNDHPEYLSMDRVTLVLQLLADTQLAIKHNMQINQLHWRRTILSAIATILGSVGLFMLL